MPSLMPGTPGAKEVYGISVVAPDGTIRIPPKACAHYEFNAGEVAIAATPHRGEAGFALLNKGRAEATVFRKYISRLDKPEVVRRFQEQAYALVRLGNGSIRLAPALLEAFHLKPDDQLMSVKGATVAMSFTPVEIWKEKFLKRGLAQALANLDKLETF